MMLESISNGIRRNIVKMYYRAGWGHLAPALSCVDILVSICFGISAEGTRLFDVDNDSLIMSKGHGCASLYAIYAELGMIEKKELSTFYKDNSRLIGLASPLIPGIDIPTGSLGHGICFATGKAFASKLDKKTSKTYVILGDGESQEGSVWEAAEFASIKGLDNLIVILDHNRLQASDWVENIVKIDPIKERWQSFGWNVIEAEGHDHSNLIQALSLAVSNKDKPTIIVANTIKGKGLRLVENRPEWHSRTPKGDEWDSVCEDLGITRGELETI